MSELDSKLEGILPVIVGVLKNVPLPEQALEVMKKVNQLLQFALPIAKMVAATTPSQADDQVVSTVHNFGLVLSDLLGNDRPTTVANANRQMLSVEILRNDLIKRVENNEQIEFGKRMLLSKEDVLAIPLSILNAVVVSAHSINKTQI